MVVDRREIGVGLGGDVAQRGGVDSPLGKEALGGVEQAVAELESAANQWFETDWLEFRTAVKAFGLTLFGD